MIAELDGRIIALLASQLRAAGVPRAADTAHGVFLILAGTILDQPTPAAHSTARRYITAITGLQRPSRRPSAATASLTRRGPQQPDQPDDRMVTAPGGPGTEHRQQ